MKNYILVTGSLGLIGFEVVKLFIKKGHTVIGIDNDLRGKFFNIKTNYQEKLKYLNKIYKKNYIHYNLDIRDKKRVLEIFKEDGKNIKAIIHTAAQTSHDWSAKNPVVDFSINATSTLNLLELYRKYCPKAIFIFTSTNKVYGDLVNNFKYKESKTRFDLEVKNKYYQGIIENLSIDQSKHSPFGVSKASADLLVQEYGRYFNLKTGVFRLGVVAGSGQNGALEQGFLSYMINKFINNEEFKIIGYKGKQVRDIIHAKDVAEAFYLFSKKPRKGEVFNLGGGRKNNSSILELIEKVSKIVGKKPKVTYQNQPRSGDHKWWITDCSKFKKMYPSWKVNYNIDDIILDIYKQNYDLQRKIQNY